MKARELIQRYRQGERDFRGVDLRDQSLRGANLQSIDLSGANLIRTDLRGTKLDKAQLISTDFDSAHIGTQRRWIAPVLLSSLLLSIVTYFLLGAFLAAFFTAILESSANIFDLRNSVAEVAAGALGLWMIATTFWVYYRQGFLAALGAVAGAVAGAFAIAITIAVAIAVASTGTDTSAVSAALASAISVSFAGSVAITFAGAISVAFAIAFTIAFVVANSRTFAFTIAIATAGTVAVAATFTGTVAEDSVSIPSLVFITVLLTTAVNYLVAYRAVNGDSRDRLVRDVSVRLLSLGGTSFRQANLTNASFTHAVVKAGHFQDAILHRTRFHLARKLHLSRTSGTVLNNRTVLDLLVSLKPDSDHPYVGLNLKGAYLNHADLSNLDLTETDLSGADLTGTDLQRADLTKVQALGTCFSQANLTAACVEAWNIDSSTELDGAICDHIYLLAGQQERRPHTGSFAPGEFTKLFEEVLTTVDLIFRDGIDWRAFLQTFKTLQVEQADAQLEIQSIENKGDGVMVVRLKAAPEANKEQIHRAFKQGYGKALKAAEQKYRAALQGQAVKIQHQEDIISQYRERNADLKEITMLMAQRPINTTAISESKAMQGNDQSQKIKVDGDFTISAQDSAVVNLGTISGQVTHQINQLGSNAPQLQDLLTQLQQAIEAEAALSDTDKADALEQVEKLAAAGQAPQENQSRAKRAIGVIQDITEGLTETNKLVDVCKNLLPAIGVLFAL